MVEEEDENEDEATYVVGEDIEDENDNINEMDPSNLKQRDIVGVLHVINMVDLKMKISIDRKL